MPLNSINQLGKCTHFLELFLLRKSISNKRPVWFLVPRTSQISAMCFFFFLESHVQRKPQSFLYKWGRVVYWTTHGNMSQIDIHCNTAFLFSCWMYIHATTTTIKEKKKEEKEKRKERREKLFLQGPRWGENNWKMKPGKNHLDIRKWNEDGFAKFELIQGNLMDYLCSRQKRNKTR